MTGMQRVMPNTPSRKLSGCVVFALTARVQLSRSSSDLKILGACLQEARKVRESAQVAWVPRFFEARNGGWALKAGIKEAFIIALEQAPAEPATTPQQPATPASAVRRSADGVNVW
jgi:hypothetical protein